MKLLRRSAVAIALFAAACGGGRTAPATQPGSPKAFNAAASDPKAVALVDQMLGKLGGAAQWDKVKQIKWEQRYMRDGKMTAMFRHAWDRWNGRHRFEIVDLASMAKAKASGGPDADDVKVTVGMYDLYDHQGKGTATVGGQPTDAATRDQIVARSFEAWQGDAYRLTAIYKAKDPGVKLSLKGQAPTIKEYCKPSCDLVEVSFAPEVGKDIWFISINTQSKMPDVIGKQLGDNKQLAYGLTGWTQVGALKFPTKFENLGASEVFEIHDIQIGDPQDELYVPAVGG
jgi:hypothetical protein